MFIQFKIQIAKYRSDAGKADGQGVWLHHLEARHIFLGIFCVPNDMGSNPMRPQISEFFEIIETNAST